MQIRKGAIPVRYSGQRLDFTLEWLLPGWSLRKRRTLWDSQEVFVDGKPRSKGYKVKSGQWVVLSLTEDAKEQDFPFALWPELKVVTEHEKIAALYKPAGLHCQAQGSKKAATLEGALEHMFAGQEIFLLNRLDQATSGLVLVALDKKSEERYYRLQQEGEVLKSYWALVSGKLREDITCTWKIASAKRRRVRVVKSENHCHLRWTRVRPLRWFGDYRTLVQAQILKGQRHQIRAHLAFAGFPIVGDTLYGPAVQEEDLLFLHHYQVSMPGFAAQAQPSWPGFSWEQLPLTF